MSKRKLKLSLGLQLIQELGCVRNAINKGRIDEKTDDHPIFTGDPLGRVPQLKSVKSFLT